MIKLHAAVAAAIGLLVLAVAAAASAKPLSHAEALKEGNPAATAPAFTEDAANATYLGRAMGSQFVKPPSFSCLAVDQGPDRCYEDAASLERAESSPRANVSRHGRAPKARAAVDCGIYSLLFIYTGAEWTGASAALEERFRWANLRAEVNNEGSSFLMGEYSGHLAEGLNGAGYWYPGDTSACAVENNLNTNGSGWNNRISSRYRN